jgi:hypothetical protein
MKLNLVKAKSLLSSHVLEEEEDCKMAAISHISEDHCKTSKDHGNREIEVDGVKKLCTKTQNADTTRSHKPKYIQSTKFDKNKSSRKKKKGKNSRIGGRERGHTWRMLVQSP